VEEKRMQVPAPFEYERATTVDHAIALLERGGAEARVIAGGHSLLPMMKLRLARPGFLVDINDLKELDYIRRDGGVVRIGALTRHRALLESELVGSLFPIFHDAERVIADPVVRNRGSIGGSLCQADPSEDLCAVCEALGAQLVIRGATGTRTVPIDEFLKGPYETDVADGEILIEVQVPVQANSGSAYEKVERKAGDWAVAAAGAAVVLTGGRITDVGIGVAAVNADTRRAVEAVRGQEPAEELYAAAAAMISADCSPNTDNRGPAEYKRHLAGELTARALRRAVARAAVAGG
jgi:aerobic carbon-monoxide dehydrogenase medium subunit